MRTHRHLGVYAILENEGQLLLIKKSRGAYKGKLDLPGGGMEHGETAEETLKRELEEETGLTLKSYELINIFTNHVVWEDLDQEEDLHHIGIIYKIKANLNDTLKSGADGQDSLGASWYSIEKLKEESLSPFAIESLKYLK